MAVPKSILVGMIQHSPPLHTHTHTHTHTLTSYIQHRLNKSCRVSACVCVCVCVSRSQVQPLPQCGDQVNGILPANGAMASHSRTTVGLSTGCHPMAPLSALPEYSPTEDLQTSWAVVNSAHRGAKRRCFSWQFGSWNVRSLLDNERPIETARQGPECHQLAEDRRIDLVVRELNRYNITVAALQKTKWFGEATYRVGESFVVLTAGRPTPQANQSKQRGEGVAIVLGGPAVAAWKMGGEQWRTWGSRLIRVTLAIGKGASDSLHVFSCYAPTYAASREAKDDFFDDLQRALDEVPPEESLVLLGDFNACVGSRNKGDDPWEGVRGPHGMGEVNEAGRDLVNFLLLNEATIYNTWFQKMIHKQTWQHPKSKQWHCIDFAVVHHRDRERCLGCCSKTGS